MRKSSALSDPGTLRPGAEGRRTRAEQRAATFKSILDTGEELFSQRGYFGVTIKDVADKIGIHPALIHYYFDGKRALFDAVFDRRMVDAVAARAMGLDAYEASLKGRPTIEGVLRAYYDEAFEVHIKGDEGSRNFGRIFSQVANAPGYGVEKMDESLDPLVLRLIDLLQRAAPSAAREDLFWGFQFTSGAYALILSRTGRIDRLSRGLCRSDDFEAARERFVTFMAAGFASLIRQRKKPQGKSKAGRKRATAPGAAG